MSLWPRSSIVLCFPVAEDKTDDIVMSWIDKNGIFGYQLIKVDNEAQEGLETEFNNVRVFEYRYEERPMDC